MRADVVRALKDLLENRVAYAEHDGERFFDAVQNARLVANAERYYRVMYYGSRASWNLRDEHMFTTLKNLLAFYGTGSKAIVWAHNSHVGDAAATEMASRGEHNIGQLMSPGIRRRCLLGRLRHRQRNRCGGNRLGRADGDQEGSAGTAEEL